MSCPATHEALRERGFMRDASTGAWSRERDGLKLQIAFNGQKATITSVDTSTLDTQKWESTDITALLNTLDPTVLLVA